MLCISLSGAWGYNATPNGLLPYRHKRFGSFFMRLPEDVVITHPFEAQGDGGGAEEIHRCISETINLRLLKKSPAITPSTGACPQLHTRL